MEKEKGEIVRTAEPKTLFQILSFSFYLRPYLLVPLKQDCKTTVHLTE
jgi:hypothetical protein